MMKGGTWQTEKYWKNTLTWRASCLNKEERLKVMDMLYKYKEAFSLRDEIGTCPNIVLCKAVLTSVPYFLICLGFCMHFISLYDALSLHNCSSSGSLVFACLGSIY